MFPTGRDSATFWDKGTKVPSFHHCPGTKGQQAKNLAKGRDGPGRRDGGTKQDRVEKNVLKQEKDVLKQKRTF